MPNPVQVRRTGPAAMRAAALLLAAIAFCGSGHGALGSDEWFLEADDRLRFTLGQVVFRKQWISAPASTTASDGLGPLYNARSCARCHPQGGRGQPDHGPAHGVSGALVVRLSVPPRTPAERALLAEHRAHVLPEPTYGLQLQPLAVQGHRGEGQVEVGYDEVPVVLGDGDVVRLRKPSYRLVSLGYGPPRADAVISPRVAPPLIGLGLLEMVPEDQVLEREREPDHGAGGYANRVWSQERGEVVLGRFGWKASVPTVRRQVAEAFAIDLGISTSLVEQPAGDCTPQQVQCRQAPDGRSARHGGHELADVLLDLVTFYVANAGVPSRSESAPGMMDEGEALFLAVGCAACHRPSFVTGTTGGPPQLRGRVIWPYTDLFLHDMGEDLADVGPEGLAESRMWRTAPLWGVGQAQTPDGRQTFLHDG